MSPTLVIDVRVSAWRRRLGPTAWAVLEEAALVAEKSQVRGLEAQLSARELRERLGIGREPARRALAALVDAGLLVRPPARRDGSGRFCTGAYLVLTPAGLFVVGEPGPALAAVEPGGVTLDATVDHTALEQSAVSAEQASLFADDAPLGDVDPVVQETTPTVSNEPRRAKERDSCEVVYRVHELAPSVRSATPSSRARDGRSSC
jgi:hypothetical protein